MRNEVSQEDTLKCLRIGDPAAAERTVANGNSLSHPCQGSGTAIVNGASRTFAFLASGFSVLASIQGIESKLRRSLNGLSLLLFQMSRSCPSTDHASKAAAASRVELPPVGIGWSIHRNGGWKGQLERTERWYSRFVAFSARPSAEDPHALEDCAFAFFQNCHHLREWVQQTSDVKQQQLDQLIANHTELQLCRDLANGTKHLNITYDNVVDRHFSIAREYDPCNGGDRRIRLCLIAGKTYDLRALAGRCLAIWKEFLTAYAG